jgi:hypothetical protein
MDFRKMAPIPWTIGDDNRLRELARSGISMIEIAARMNRTKWAIRGRAEKLKIAIAPQENAMQRGTLRVTPKM